MVEPHQKIICGTCCGDGKGVSFTGADIDCQSCGGVGSYYEASIDAGSEIAPLRLENAHLKAECARLLEANSCLQNQFDHAEKVYRANSQSYRDEIAELRSTLSATGTVPPTGLALERGE